MRVRVLRGSMCVRCSDLDYDDEALLRALSEGDERVFSDLVDCWSHVMLRLALSRVESRAVAEEVVQDAWLTVLRSLDRYEHRSTRTQSNSQALDVTSLARRRRACPAMSTSYAPIGFPVRSSSASGQLLAAFGHERLGAEAVER